MFMYFLQFEGFFFFVNFEKLIQWNINFLFSEFISILIPELF